MKTQKIYSNIPISTETCTALDDSLSGVMHYEG